MKNCEKIVHFCNQLLNVEAFSDYPKAYNGLQVANSGQIRKIGAAVDANLFTIRRAVEEKIDLLFVHHGLFWGRPVPIVGTTYDKYKLLLENDLALYSAHLPLDCQRDFGNNAAILQKLGLEAKKFYTADHDFYMPLGECNQSRIAFQERISQLFPESRSLNFGPETVRRVLVCSGGGGGIISSMEPDFDTVVTGEAPRHFYDYVLENRINAYICGHYATEIFGVRNLARKVAETFELPCLWIREDCPL